MGPTWNHPDLGRFKFGDSEWTATVSVPAFKSFTYDLGGGRAYRSKGKHELLFEAEDEKDEPSRAAVALARKVVANQAELVTKVTKSLWNDFCGRGPKSGMWWQGDLGQVAEAMGAEEPPGGPDDLLKIMQLSQITILKKVDGYKKPVVELSFHAAFEEEHGVSLLTDGRKILGLGYTADVAPFRPARKRPSGRGR